MKKAFTLWTGYPVELNYKFRAILDEYIKQSSLDNMNVGVNTVSHLLSKAVVNLTSTHPNSGETKIKKVRKKRRKNPTIASPPYL
jgi:hypothetical protein